MISIGSSPRCLGIIGGMGPRAGLYLQQLIVAATPATCDQDHLPIVSFSNPLIPDRTTALASEQSRLTCVRSIQATARSLLAAGADVLVMPCHTAHLFLPDIQAGISAPFINLVEVTIQAAVTQNSAPVVGLLGTAGTLQHCLYQRASAGRPITWVVPTPEEQAIVSDVIYATKMGAADVTTRLVVVLEQLMRRGATKLLLACTELSLAHDDLVQRGLPVLDPLRMLSASIVQTWRSELRLTSTSP